ncbi:piRNA biogenesis protein EXD1 [Chanos chanos]|uniref:PiRNA biogenesis protein EXD1 n=1 Tax=Chanos chanos TaxID=29144 RepID=A0A6J2WG91_CHACN|nr:piRNA biogenesis protein EXD1 [Chanos chanos]
MDCLEDHQFLESFKRKRVKLTLKSATFVGIIQRINLNKTIILESVEEVNSGRKFPGVKLFFGHEIQNDVDDDEECVSFAVIDDFREMFGPAVMHIRKQQVIGIGTDGVGEFHQERLCWLQIATKKKVYLFDILLLGARAFKNGLSMILENNHILKVVHDCRGIARCLVAQFGVNLTNVFDTQVADVMYFYTETGGFLPDRLSTLQEVLSLYLKIPASHTSSLKTKSQLTKEDKELWYVRPCPVSLLKVMSLSVVHLQPLRLVLLDALMYDYTSLVDSYLGCSKDEYVHVQYIGKSGLKLPKELQELLVIWRERRDWAVERYPMTEEGLLDRSNPKPSPHPEASISRTSGPSEHGQLSPGSQPEETKAQTGLQASADNNSDITGQSGYLSPTTLSLGATTVGPRKETCLADTPVSSTGGSGLLEAVMDTMRSATLSDDETTCAHTPVPTSTFTLAPKLATLPSIGRGLSLPILAQGPVQTRSVGEKAETEVMVGSSISKPLSTMEGVTKQDVCLAPMPAAESRLHQRPQILTSPLNLSFCTFRNDK